MNIVVIGASRGIGREAVRVALERGHRVTAFSRHPESLDLESELSLGLELEGKRAGFARSKAKVQLQTGLAAVQAESRLRLQLRAGDVLDVAAVRQAVRGREVVICALGLPTLQAMGPPFARRSSVLSTGTRNILEAMAAEGVKRLLCVTAIGAGDSVRQCTPLTRVVLRRGLRWLFQEKDRQEKLITASGLEQWTIIRPTALTNGRAKDALTSPDLRSGLLTQVSRADVAETMVDMIDQPESFGQALVVSYPARFGDSVRWVAGYFGIG